MQRKIHNFDSAILDDITFEKEGYYPSQFGPSSAKFIWAACRFCGHPSRLSKAAYKKASNSACHKECRLKEQSIAGSPFKDQAVRDKAKQTNLERYGSESASQSKDVSAKISQTLLSQECQNKTKQTNLKKYGVENTFQSKEIQEKIKDTMIKNYGVDHPLKSDQIKEKIRNTCLDRYGCVNPMQNDKIKQKASDTSLAKYGHRIPMHNPDIQKKQLQTISEKYGVLYPIQNPKIKKRIQDTNKARYGSFSPLGNQVVRQKARDTTFLNYGVENPFACQEIRKRIQETFLAKYGVKHPSQCPAIREKIVQSFTDRFGVDNPMKDPVFKQDVMDKYRAFVEKNPNGYFDVINTLRSTEIWDKMAEGLSLQKLSELFNLHYPSLAAAVNEQEFKILYNNLYAYPKSQMQMDIAQEIKQFYKCDIVTNSRTIIKPLELDVFLPTHKFAIEFNGNFWHSEAMLDVKQAKCKHITKTEMCSKIGVRLFHIFEHQWVYRKKQIINFIKTILGLNTVNIGARKCQINHDECRDFINDNHIQGYGTGTIKYFNLVYNKEIIASMTASKHHRQNVDGKPIVLNRLCFKDGINVQGGSSKLFKNFVAWAKQESYDRIISWSDNCWTEGNIYKVLGFTLEKNYGPGYFYWDVAKKQCYSKQSQRKAKVACPENMMEHEWCMQRGLYRVWDTGKRLWIYDLLGEHEISSSLAVR